MKFRFWLAIPATAIIATLSSSACSNAPTEQARTDDDEDATSSTTFALSGASFAGNSIRICGARNKAADGKYRCSSRLSTNSTGGDSKSCPCFNFDDDGRLIDPSTGQEVEIGGLCPSENFPTADWTFSYSIFSAPLCKGAQINGGKHNFTCYDEHDLGKKNHPNKSVEALVRGENVNQIVCLTENARKNFAFKSCAERTSSSDADLGLVRFDCGCAHTGKACGCGATGITEHDLQNGCTFEASSCNILCSANDDDP